MVKTAYMAGCAACVSILVVIIVCIAVSFDTLDATEVGLD
jgi:hypothetical protein